ncbi:hypothetical protein SASPL_148199 [Salvia splendens]|uniref:hAT-like transposase RNase-H fold domain-containing protein n=1 Tax=Salvia splendens TaxID=180675 RepID=A0A8X8Z424_SALSN|nr:zinc finger BED domain-containing protein RICESLEEPER 3-like [Salvia splendens]KAG6390464.1 hypothetical protein SASPL_148199 [Salvia splendens]
MGIVSIASHCWTALNNTNFICVSAHCIGKDWKLHKKIISFCKVESHNASTIGDSIVMSLKEWGLTNLFSCTMDIAPENEKAVQHVKYHVETLNKYTIDCKKPLCLHVPTRWDSTYLMLESALPYEEAFTLSKNQHSCFVEVLKQRKHNDLSIGPPKKEDWANVKNMMEYLRKFYALTRVFSATRYPTSHLFFAEMCDFFDLISTLEMSDDSGVSAMARKMRSKIGKYWSEETELNPNLNRIVYIAAALDPRQKMRHVETCFKTIYGEERGADMVREVTDSMNELFEFYRAQDVTPTLPRLVDTSTVVPRVCSNGRVSLRFMALQSSVDEETSDVNELTLYLKAKRHMVLMDEIDNFDILKWWFGAPLLPRFEQDGKGYFGNSRFQCCF